jgi:hypothetical protein
MACVDAAPWCAYAAARLLAFLYVAACFSMESAEQDAAIWALSTEFTMGHMSNLLSETKTMLDLEEESRAVLQAHFSGRQSSTCVMLVEPQRMNARLAVQQGCFVVPGDLSKSFMENLAHCLEVDVSVLAVKRARSMRCGDADRPFETPVVKIVLPKEIHNQAAWDLDQMNVNATSFFPGLDGFARSLHTWFRDVIQHLRSRKEFKRSDRDDDDALPNQRVPTGQRICETITYNLRGHEGEAVSQPLPLLSAIPFCSLGNS